MIHAPDPPSDYPEKTKRAYTHQHSDVLFFFFLLGSFSAAYHLRARRSSVVHTHTRGPTYIYRALTITVRRRYKIKRPGKKRGPIINPPPPPPPRRTVDGRHLSSGGVPSRFRCSIRRLNTGPSSCPPELDRMDNDPVVFRKKFSSTGHTRNRNSRNNLVRNTIRRVRVIYIDKRLENSATFPVYDLHWTRFEPSVLSRISYKPFHRLSVSWVAFEIVLQRLFARNEIYRL